MQYRLLGRSGIRVSTICVGSAALGVAPLEQDAPKLYHQAIDMGINFFDTATTYGNQQRFDRPNAPTWDQRKSAEEILGIALKGKRNDVIVATKCQERFGPGVNDGGRDGGGLTRYNIMKRVELSLQRLQMDHVDILYAHHPEPSTPIEETLRAFDDLVHQGKVRYVALSTYAGWQIVEAMWTADKYNLYAPICHQVPYNMVMRAVEREVVPVCEKYNIGLTCFSPLMGGLLTGMETLRSRPVSELGGQRWNQGQGPGFSPEQMKAAEQLDAVAKQWEIPAAQLALGWLLSRPTVNSVIIGPENIKELEANAPAADLKLTKEQIETLDAIGKDVPVAVPGGR